MIKKISNKTIKLINYYNLINYNLVYNNKAINRFKKVFCQSNFHKEIVY